MAFRSVKAIDNGSLTTDVRVRSSNGTAGIEPAKLQPPKELPIVIPEDIELFLDDADVPHIRIPQAKGRKTLPICHKLVRGYVINFLFRLSGGRLPGKADVEAFLSVLEAQALLFGQRETEESDWKEDVLEDDALALCLYTLVERKAPQPLEATAGQVLDAVDELAAKERVEKPDDWPRSPSRMSIAIKQRRLVLNELGVVVTKLPRKGTARNWRFEMNPSDGGDASDTPTSGASCHPSQPNSFLENGLGASSADDDAFFASLMQKANEEGPRSPLDGDEIRLWVPDKWEQFCANESAVENLTTIVDDLLVDRPGRNLLLTGDEDTGRGALVIHAVRSLLCHEPQGIDPCGVCLNCEFELGVESEFGRAENDGKFNFLHVDCGRLDSDRFAKEVSKVIGYAGRLLVYLCRLDRLKEAMVPQLLDTMKDKRFIWFATAARAGDVATELLTNFAVEQTTRPTEKELAFFLAERCRDWAIKVDSGQTLLRLAHRCGQVTGEALSALALAAEREDRTLNAELVEDAFDVKE